MGKVFTGFGYWDVGAWIIFYIVAAAYVLWLRYQGRQDYKKGTEQDEIYWSGNETPEDGEGLTVPASSAYWGFRKALEPFYDRLVGMHTGVASDILGYYVVVVAFMAAIILLV